MSGPLPPCRNPLHPVLCSILCMYVAYLLSYWVTCVQWQRWGKAGCIMLCTGSVVVWSLTLLGPSVVVWSPIMLVYGDCSGGLP